MSYPLVMEMIRVASPDLLVTVFKRLSEGDAEVLAEIYDELAPKIYGMALWRTSSEQDAADVVQKVFVKLVMRARELDSVRKPLSYVPRMAHHECIDLLRQRKRETYARLEAGVTNAVLGTERRRQ